MTTQADDIAARGETPRWRPAPAVWLSIALHGAAVLALVALPALWAWILTILAANHLFLIGAVFWPCGALLGPNVVRLPAGATRRGEVALTFDDGPDPEVTPHVLELLDRYGMKASFFCVGEKAAAFPEIVKDIDRRGHSVENHSFHHSYAFAFYGVSRLGREVETAQSVVRRITGRAPAFFRAPAGFRSVLLDPVLAKRGLRYVSWTRRAYDAVRSDPHAALARLTNGLAAGDVLLLHDGHAARTPEGEPLVLAMLPALLARLVDARLTSVSLPMAFSGSALS